ncbi:hypothetical protein K435DRAFT_664583 [Dendrothele bispora CBS 962.96]|uniref:DUF659 domain-containing protein n=1 Tax=Dendrothele bispora (strain CBS 962.96) TaxID=1314807 RepID=A0A4S8M2P9_DENBC|nr:hypothetical protein K435DRAFT_664583 [Dendrothele bispora CBS 962.96]
MSESINYYKVNSFNWFYFPAEIPIDFRKLIGEHSDANMADAVWATLKKFCITDCVIAFVMDNVSHNDTMIECFADKCFQHDISFSEKNAHMCCMPHTIHLSALKVHSLRILFLDLIHLSPA